MNSSSFLRRTALSLALCALATFSTNRAAHAVPIAVPNYSFEDGAANDGSFTIPIPNWQINPGPGSDGSNAATFDPSSRDYDNAGGEGTPTGGDGAQHAYIGNTESIQSLSSLATIKAGDVYTLDFAAGNIRGGYSNGLRYGFLVNDAFVAGSTATTGDLEAVIPDGTFANISSFSYTATADDVGKGLKIFLGKASGGGNAAYDNVRLDVTNVAPVPEPSTYAMMALGLGAMGLVMRRKRDGAVDNSN